MNWAGLVTRLLRRWIEATENHPLLATLIPLIQQSSIYLVGAGLLGMGNFVLVPLYTRHLSATEFGVYALVEIAVLMTVTAAQLGLGTAYLRWHVETGPELRGDVLGSCMAAALAAGILGGTALVLLAGPWGAEWFRGLGAARWFLLPIVIFRNGQGLFFSVLQASHRAAAYVIAALARLILLSATGTWLVANNGLAVRGILVSWLIADGACFLLLVVLCGRRQRLRLRHALLVSILKYGYPLVWTSFLALVLDASGRYFLAKEQSLAEVSTYVVGIKIANIVSMGFLQPFGNAWAGLAFAIAQRPNAQLTYTKILGYALVVGMLLISVIVLFGPYLVKVFAGQAYAGAARLLPWLLLPVAFRLLEYWSCMPLYLKYKTQWLGVLNSAGAAACVAFNLLLVPRFGTFGAAWSWAAALTVNVSLMTLVGRKYYAFPWDVKTMAFAAGLWLAGASGSRAVEKLGGSSGLALAAAGTALFLAACVWYFRRDVRETSVLFAESVYAD